MEDEMFKEKPDVEITLTEDTGDKVRFLLTIHHVDGTDQKEVEISGIAVAILRTYQRLMHQPTLADALASHIRESLEPEEEKEEEEEEPWSADFAWDPPDDDDTPF